METGESDLTALPVDEHPESLISPSALEYLRDAARREGAATELLAKTDLDLLAALDVLRHGKLTRAGILLAGSAEAIARHVPRYVWTYLRMERDTDYRDRLDGREAIMVAVARILDRIMADNPITTVQHGPFHFEYRTYPEIALREALLNALCHADYQIASPILVKHYREHLEITNPGSFIGGIRSDNILHHAPAARNPCLVDALVRLRLVNRSNVGVQRMFRALLVEGKEPPSIVDISEFVRVTFRATDLSAPFRSFVADEDRRGIQLSVDHLLILHYLLRHPEIDSVTATEICQRPEHEAREVLAEMERRLEYLERGGTGRGTYWSLRPELHRRFAVPGHPERNQRLDWEAAKTRVLSILRQRSARGEEGLSNAELRQLTHFDRHQAKRLMDELREEGQAELGGITRNARWVYRDRQRD